MSSAETSCRGRLMPLAAAILAAAIVAVACIPLAELSADDDVEYDEDLGVLYGYTIQFLWTGSDAVSVTWDFGDGSDTVTGDSDNTDGWNPVHTYEATGVYYVTQTAYNTYDGGSYSVAVYKLTIAGYPWIEFESNGGSEVETIYMTSGGASAVAAEQPEDPTREGYTFGGWYMDEELTVAYDWSSVVTVPITLYAMWVSEDGEAAADGDDEDDNGIDWLWIALAVLAVILLIAAVATGHWILLIPAVVLAAVAALLYLGMI